MSRIVDKRCAMCLNASNNVHLAAPYGRRDTAVTVSQNGGTKKYGITFGSLWAQATSPRATRQHFGVIVEFGMHHIMATTGVAQLRIVYLANL